MIKSFSTRSLLLLVSLFFIFGFNIYAIEAAPSITINIQDESGSSVAGAKWKISAPVQYESDWQNSGDTIYNLTKNTTYTIVFSTVEGYDSPPPLSSGKLNNNSDFIGVGEYISTGEVVNFIDNWSLVPMSPQGIYSEIEYDPLSFTIVGRDRNYLAWVKSIIYEDHDFRGCRLYLSNLSTDTVSSDVDINMNSRSIKYMTSQGDTGSSISSLTETNLRGHSVFPEYVEEWQNISGEVVANQYFDNFISDWYSFVDGPKPPDNDYLADSGHSYPQLIWPDNVWLTFMDGYSTGENFKQYLIDAYADEGWGDAVLFVGTNEGLIHAFGVEPFSEHWAIMPMPALQWAVYQEQLKQHDGTEYPRINLLDGPIAISDVEHSEAKWRRILVGTTGTGFDMQTKTRGMYNLEGSGLTDPEVEELDGSVARKNMHSWGIYTLNVAEKDSSITPETPQMLWNVSNTYWTNVSSDLSETHEGVLTVNGTRHEYSDTPPSGYSGYRDIYLSLSRPVIGMTENSNDERIWHSVFVALNVDEEFVLYDVNANTGEILQSKNLGQVPTILKNGSGATYSWDVVWNPSFEWKFPTRMGAIAKDSVRDKDPENLSSVNLYRVPYLKDFFVHLSNGALYRWDVYDSYINGFDSDNLRLLMVNQYQAYEEEYGGDLVAGPSTQDFDGTYLNPLEGPDNIYHRFLALALKGGRAQGAVGGDIRALVQIDIDKIMNDNIVLQINKNNAWGHGNKDRIEYLYQDNELYGWFLNLAAGDANVGKFWQESLTISAPVYIDGQIVLATFQPETGTSWIYNLPSSPSDKLDVTGDQYQTSYENTEFEGGATLTVNEQGDVEFYIGTSGGTTTSQEMDLDLFDNSGSLGINGNAGTLYWKIRN